MSFRPLALADDHLDEDTVRGPCPFVAPPGDPCEAVAAHIVDGVSGELPIPLEAHVHECERCHALVSALARIDDDLRVASGRYRHADDFEARVLARIDGEGGRD